MRIGIDSGGTFTDFVILHDDGRLESFKLRSQPASPAAVIREGLRRAGGRNPEVVHGSTVATNALLERKGARTALVTTSGFEDVIQIGRQNRRDLYDLNPPPRRPLIPQADCFGVEERTWFDGTAAVQPAEDLLNSLRGRLAGYEAVAICFLHSYANPANEQAAENALAGDWYLCSSHRVCPEFREYERTSTTVLNAYVGPLMDRYLRELPEGILVMQSNGGMMTTGEARLHAVRTLLSGPAGGAIGAVRTASASGFPSILGFDMGGTSTDVSLSTGEPRMTMEAAIDGLPVRVPMLDIHTVGAGGGSIARVDEGGLLRVGPESAGSSPGPACYGEGDEATVTDAHLVLGRIGPDQLLGGEMRLHEDRAIAAVDRIAAAMQVDRMQAAEGIVRVANASMERAIRVVSVERGYDPREFALAAFGGCGGLHACEIAAALGIRTVLAPDRAGVLSALGMLLADRIRDYAAGVLAQTGYEKQFRKLEKQARAEMRRPELLRFADLRYAGQSYELTLPWGGDFHAEHERVYGYADRARPVEVVALRVRAVTRVQPPELRARRTGKQESAGERRVWTGGRWRKTPLLKREQLKQARRGPLLVLDYGATIFIPAGWTAQVDRVGAVIARLR